MNNKKINLIVLGDASVGKTSLIKQYTGKGFTEEHLATMGLDFAKKTYTARDNKEHDVKVWDTAGQERFRTLTQTFYKQADGVIVAYDTTSKISFQNVNTWMKSIKDHANQGLPMIIVANKIDLVEQRAISQEEGQ